MASLEELGVRFHSPSSINAFLVDPALWVCRYALKNYSSVSFGPWAWAGDATESGVHLAVADPTATPDAIMERALHTWALKRGEDLEKRLGELRDADQEQAARDALPGLLEAAVPRFRGFGRFHSHNGRVRWRPEWSQVDIIGYYDFAFEDADFDLKVKSKRPSEPVPANVRQAAIYGMARGRPQHLVYAKAPGKRSPGFLAPVEVSREVADPHLADVERAVGTMQRMAGLVRYPEDLLALTMPNFESFYWDDNLKEVARSLWNLKQHYVWPKWADA